MDALIRRVDTGSEVVRSHWTTDDLCCTSSICDRKGNLVTLATALVNGVEGCKWHNDQFPLNQETGSDDYDTGTKLSLSTHRHPLRSNNNRATQSTRTLWCHRQPCDTADWLLKRSNDTTNAAEIERKQRQARTSRETKVHHHQQGFPPLK